MRVSQNRFGHPSSRPTLPRPRAQPTSSLDTCSFSSCTSVADFGYRSPRIILQPVRCCHRNQIMIPYLSSIVVSYSITGDNGHNTALCHAQNEKLANLNWTWGDSSSDAKGDV